eukprot:gb/GEZJ01004277.1/.p1 GENE.gb/GEZJ01004277.1/~~gb/GEZJ01004277.1/.p1  ORF type:complete len:280 (-),score=22.37 gb/GEZJ01004277.1/:285-1124(-)
MTEGSQAAAFAGARTNENAPTTQTDHGHANTGNGATTTQANQDPRLTTEAPVNSFSNPQANTFPHQTYGGGYPNPYYAPYNGSYGTSYLGGYGNGFGNYGAGYGTAFGGYSGNYAGNPAFNFGTRQQFSAGQVLDGARHTSEMVMTGMHDAMARFARISSMIEDILRNLHMLFDALFGLGYSLGAFKHEATMLLAVKTGPVAHIAQLLRRAFSVWRLLCLFFMSPLAGRLSPVALVLRILGLVPEDGPFEIALEEYQKRKKDSVSPGSQPSTSTDGSNL